MLSAFQWFFHAVDRLVAGLEDPRRSGRSVALLLLAYVLVWTLYAVLANASNDIATDMGQAVVWSHRLAFGYPMQPPLVAWLAGAWFTVFPLTDWAYYLLSMSLAAVAVWFAWAIVRDHLPAEKRVVALALLTLVPFYNIRALPFNADSVQLTAWAATTYWFLRALRTSDAEYAALAGLGAAVGMLGKYWSVMLLIGLAAAAFVSPHRRDFFRSPAPWIIVAVGSVVIAPNVAWLWAHDFSPFHYAVGMHVGSRLTEAMRQALRYVDFVLAVAAVPAALVLLAARPRLSTWVDMVWPPDADRRALVVAFVVPLLVLPLAAALLFDLEVLRRWAIPSMALLPVVLLSPAGIVLGRQAMTRLVMLALVYPGAMVAAAPAIALGHHLWPEAAFSDQFRLVAQEVDKSWHDATKRPMRLFGGATKILDGVAFYLTEKAATFDLVIPQYTPWAGDGRVARDGIAMVCWLRDQRCLARMNALIGTAATAVRSRDVEISRPFWGIAGAPISYRIVVILPPGDMP